jgi:hypothetical protein
MMVNDITKLAQEIQDASAPRWLHEYLAQHRDQMRAELELFGQCEIPMPDGGVIEIRREFLIKRTTESS